MHDEERKVARVGISLGAVIASFLLIVTVVVVLVVLL
jgi:hypothetical protein